MLYTRMISVFWHQVHFLKKLFYYTEPHELPQDDPHLSVWITSVVTVIFLDLSYLATHVV